MGRIWWKNISKAAYLIQSVANTLLDGRSLILTVPETVPWKSDMMDLIREKLSNENNERCLKELDCPELPAGKYLLEQFCKREKRVQYRPGKSIASFLAQSEGIVLNSSDLWIRNPSQEQLDDWCSFIDEYIKNVPAHSPHAVFILELQESIKIPKGFGSISHISFRNIIEPFDVYTFCALTCPENGFNELERLYLAQTVSAICDTDVELCALCMEHRKEFLKNPAGYLKQISETALHSDGRSINLQLTDEALNTKLWESQIKVLFPIVEKYRSNFIRMHRSSIESALPVQTALGEDITSPCDVELGMLVALTGRGVIHLTGSEYDMLVLFRNARNTLAHLRIVPFAEAERILQNKQ